MWISIDSQSSIDRLLHEFAGFHDACLREVSIATETYVAENLAMSCPGHLDTSALLFLQGQNRSLPAIEIKCERVTGIRVNPTPDNCDSILAGGNITTDGKTYRLALNFMGGPLTGPPNSWVSIQKKPYTESDIEVTAESIAWRPVENGLGKHLRYRQSKS
ncbi:MAG TPA: hypothetical protein VL197_07890 [Nitrospirota bacterium]|nr:hypothetical protein [Nitrospirota bacterium]